MNIGGLNRRAVPIQGAALLLVSPFGLAPIGTQVATGTIPCQPQQSRAGQFLACTLGLSHVLLEKLRWYFWLLLSAVRLYAGRTKVFQGGLANFVTRCY